MSPTCPICGSVPKRQISIGSVIYGHSPESPPDQMMRLVQAALRAVHQCAPQPAPPHRLRHVYQPRIRKRPCTNPQKLRSDNARRGAVSQQLISLSVSWAPHAGLPRGLTQDVAQRFLAYWS
eukprot:5567361-Amphidinium_carterae.2